MRRLALGSPSPMSINARHCNPLHPNRSRSAYGPNDRRYKLRDAADGYRDVRELPVLSKNAPMDTKGRLGKGKKEARREVAKTGRNNYLDLKAFEFCPPRPTGPSRETLGFHVLHLPCRYFRRSHSSCFSVPRCSGDGHWMITRMQRRFFAVLNVSEAIPRLVEPRIGGEGRPE